MSKDTKSKHYTVSHEARYQSLRVQAIKDTAAKAKHAKARAQKIFLSMIETAVSSKYLIEQARYINPAIYEDIVSERAIDGLCGYPLCSKTFKDLYGNRTHIIRDNAVYEISFRRNFCSDVCYEASDIIHKQLATDPLYLRDSDAADIKDIKIPVLECLQGRFGKLIDITGGLLNPKEKRPKEKKSHTTFDEIAQETLITCSENVQNNGEGKSQDITSDEDDMKNADDRVKRTSETVETHCEENHKDESKSEKTSTEQSVNEQMDKAKESEDPFKSVFMVERALRQWMSFDSLRVVLGDRYVKGMLKHIGTTMDGYWTTSGLRLSVEDKAKYFAICRKLDHEEMQYDDMVSKQTEDVNVQSRLPLPIYKQLQEDAEKQKLKVVSFLGGSDQYEAPPFGQEGERDTLDTIVEEGCGPQCLGEDRNSHGTVQKIHKKAASTEVNAEGDEEGSKFPFIDNYSQVAWRRYIVEEKVSSYLQQIVKMTDLDGPELHRLVKILVATFDLSPHNISFKPRQWRLVAVIFLKMLAVRYPVIREALKKEQAHNVLKTVLSSFHLDFGYCDRILCYLTEIEYIIWKNEKVNQNSKRAKDKTDETHGELTLEENFHKVL